MAELEETAIERLLRKESETQRLFGSIRAVDNRIYDAARGHFSKLQDVARGQFPDLQHGYGLLSGFDTISRGYKPEIQNTIDPQQTSAHSQITTAVDIGTLIRRARKKMKLSQGAFAEHAGVGRRFVSELEGGKPSLEFGKVLACAAAAGVDIIARPRHAE
jgi:y4mF family transcriptional regulator